MHHQYGNVRAMITDGIKWGLAGGLGFSAIATGLFIITLGAALEHSAKLLGTVISVYLIAGPIAGTIVSLLRPLGRWAIGAAVIGACAAIPAYGGMMVAVEGPRHITWEDAQGFVILGGAIGAMAGVIVRHRLIKRGIFHPN